MDEMYRTVQNACKSAIKAHNKEEKTHVIFKEMGLYRIKPVDEIREINQKAIYGWTTPKWYLEEGMTFEEARSLFPMGNGSFVRKQFYKNSCYYSPKSFGINLYNEYSEEEIIDCIKNGQRL